MKPMELLKNAGVYLDYTVENVDADRERYRRLGIKCP